MRRSKVQGISSYRKFLKQLPPAAHNRLEALLRSAGPALAADMAGDMPSKTGHLRAGIAWRLLPASLNLKVGLITKDTQRRLYYGHILDVGFMAGGKVVKRHTLSGDVTTYFLPWKGRPALHVLSRVADDFRAQYLPNYRKLTDEILTEASQGVGSD